MPNQIAEIITPPNTLREKVAVGGPGAVDEATLKRAEQAIIDMTGEYLSWVQKDISRLEAACKELKIGNGNREQKLEEIFHVSHDIKGQGGSFGYDLMTIIGNQVCRLIEKADPDDNELIDVVVVHVEAMKLVIGSNIKGHGGRDGELMLVGLEKVCGKILD